MTERMIENRVNKLRELEAQQKELEAQAGAIRAELKADLDEKGPLHHRPTKLDAGSPHQPPQGGWYARCISLPLEKQGGK